MRNLNIASIIILFFVFSSTGFASTQVAQFFSKAPVQVCQPSDPNPSCGAEGSSGNVGIGTVNRIAQYIGTTTVGSPANDVIDSNGNVGIGTAVPNKSLCVGSTCKAYIDSSGNGFYTGSLTTTYNTMDNGSGSGHFAGGLTTQFNTLDDGSTGGAYFKGNVSIGTTSVLAPLTLAINQTANTGLTIQNATGGKLWDFEDDGSTTQGYIEGWKSGVVRTAFDANIWTLYASNGDKEVTIQQNGSDPDTGGLIALWAGNVELDQFNSEGISFFNGGNVAIGSTGANNTLEVNGGVRVEGLGASANICTDGSKNLTTSGCTGGSGTVTSIATTAPITGGTITTTGTIGIGTASPLIVSGGLLGVNTSGTWNGNAVTSTTVSTISGQLTNTSPITLSGSGTTGSPYNVGINTTGTWNGNAVTASNGINTFTTTGSSGAATYSAGTLNIPQYSGGSSQWTTTNTHDVYLPNQGNVGIGTNLTTTAALSVMNGNVGIGTWIPAGILDVEGTISPTVFYGNLKTPQQNVGIGTANPGYPLDVKGGGRFLGSGNTQLNPTSGNVGIGTTIQDAFITIGGGFQAVASTTVGRVMCTGLTTLGAACWGYCTSISTDTCACTCG